MKNDRFYRIGGLNICFSGWEPEPEENDWLPLFAAEPCEPDICIEVKLVPSIDFPETVQPEWDEPYVRSCRLGEEIHRYYRRNIVLTGADYGHLYFSAQKPQQRTLELCDRGFPLNEKQLLACISSEELFLLFDRTVMHSSCVDIGGQALLFSGVSGIGKSTQAALWETYAGAAVKNGDRNLLRFDGERELVCGLPYAGTSGICNAFELPLRAVVFLGQAKVNRIRRLPEKEAVRSLLSQFPVPKWSASSISRAMDAAMRLASHIPVYYLSCLPEQSAVELLKTTLSEEKNHGF